MAVQKQHRRAATAMAHVQPGPGPLTSRQIELGEHRPSYDSDVAVHLPRITPSTRTSAPAAASFNSLSACGPRTLARSIPTGTP